MNFKEVRMTFPAGTAVDSAEFRQDALAEGGGFEPPVDLRPHNLSKVAPSTTRTPLQSLHVRLYSACQP